MKSQVSMMGGSGGGRHCLTEGRSMGMGRKRQIIKMKRRKNQNKKRERLKKKMSADKAARGS